VPSSAPVAGYKWIAHHQQLTIDVWLISSLFCGIWQAYSAVASGNWQIYRFALSIVSQVITAIF
jgi:hypothetical protein